MAPEKIKKNYKYKNFVGGGTLTTMSSWSDESSNMVSLAALRPPGVAEEAGEEPAAASAPKHSMRRSQRARRGRRGLGPRPQQPQQQQHEADGRRGSSWRAAGRIGARRPPLLTPSYTLGPPALQAACPSLASTPTHRSAPPHDTPLYYNAGWLAGISLFSSRSSCRWSGVSLRASERTRAAHSAIAAAPMWVTPPANGLARSPAAGTHPLAGRATGRFFPKSQPFHLLFDLDLLECLLMILI